MVCENWEMVVGLSSVGVALCALGTSFWQGFLARAHARASCRPHIITAQAVNMGDFDLDVDIINNGIGPALIKDFEVYVDDVLVNGRGYKAVNTALEKLFDGYEYDAFVTGFNPDYSMQVNERQKLIRMKFSPQTKIGKKEVERILKRARFYIGYESFMKEHFETNLAIEDDTL